MLGKNEKDKTPSRIIPFGKLSQAFPGVGVLSIGDEEKR